MVTVSVVNNSTALSNCGSNLSYQNSFILSLAFSNVWNPIRKGLFMNTFWGVSQTITKSSVIRIYMLKLGRDANL